MKVKLISVGTKMPGWVQQGVEEYAKRIASELGFTVCEVPMAKRTKTANIEQCVQKEGDSILAALGKGDYLIALDVLGKQISTESLADRLAELKQEGLNISLIVGGPDGLSKECLSRANETWSLSKMAMPHPLVRIMVAEQLYRATTILKGHPYHRS